MKKPCELGQEEIGASKYLKFSPFDNYNDFAVKYESGSLENQGKRI